MPFATNAPPNAQRATTKERAETIVALDRHHAFSLGRKHVPPYREPAASRAASLLTNAARCQKEHRRLRAAGQHARANVMLAESESIREDAEVQLWVAQLEIDERAELIPAILARRTPGSIGVAELDVMPIATLRTLYADVVNPRGPRYAQPEPASTAPGSSVERRGVMVDG